MRTFLRYWLNKHGLYFPLIFALGRFKNIFRSHIYRLILWPKKGTGYTCNYCGATYARFISLDRPGTAAEAFLEAKVLDGYGPNNICPRCLSLSRERLVKIAVDHFFIGKGNNILHFGPTENEFFLLQKLGKVDTIDLQPEYYRHIDPAIIAADATCLPFDDGTYDYVVANHILEHIPDDKAAMREIFRVLKYGGTALLQAPYSTHLKKTFESSDLHDPRQQAALFGQGDHVRIYALDDYINRLHHAGFFVEIIKDDFLRAYRHFALQRDEVIILAHKRATAGTS